jgi:hypothetical protein
MEMVKKWFLFKIDKTEAKKLYIIAKAQGFKEINTNSATEKFYKKRIKVYQWECLV